MQFGDDPRLFNLLIKLAVEVAGGREPGKSARELIDEDNSEFPSLVNNRMGEMLWICSLIRWINAIRCIYLSIEFFGNDRRRQHESIVEIHYLLWTYFIEFIELNFWVLIGEEWTLFSCFIEIRVSITRQVSTIHPYIIEIEAFFVFKPQVERLGYKSDTFRSLSRLPTRNDFNLRYRARGNVIRRLIRTRI